MFRRVRVEVPSATVFVDGSATPCEPGEPLAAVLLRSGALHARIHPVSGAPRGPYCMMGVCHDCCAVVDGVPSTQTCLTAARDGMVVTRQNGQREVPDAG